MSLRDLMKIRSCINVEMHSMQIGSGIGNTCTYKFTFYKTQAMKQTLGITCQRIGAFFGPSKVPYVKPVNCHSR